MVKKWESWEATPDSGPGLEQPHCLLLAQAPLQPSSGHSPPPRSESREFTGDSHPSAAVSHRTCDHTGGPASRSHTAHVQQHPQRSCEQHPQDLTALGRMQTHPLRQLPRALHGKGRSKTQNQNRTQTTRESEAPFARGSGLPLAMDGACTQKGLRYKACCACDEWCTPHKSPREGSSGGLSAFCVYCRGECTFP